MLWKTVIGTIVFLGAIWFLGPREQVDTEITFDENTLTNDLDAYLAASEAQYSDIRPGAEKQIVWAGAPGVKTPRSIVYLHGFSSAAPEIRPVPDQVAAQLGANLYFARLAGHGRDGDAMAEPVAQDWINDLAEALAIGRALGDEVIVMGTSTGASLASHAIGDKALSKNVGGYVFVSPNFGIADPMSALLSFPLARLWAPVVAGSERAFETFNEAHGANWTTQYPTVALMPMKALVDHAATRDFSKADAPALFLLSDDDIVVRPDISRVIAETWGAGAKVVPFVMGPNDDPNSHVIAGDILSPGQNDKAVAEILQWLNEG